METYNLETYDSKHVLINGKPGLLKSFYHDEEFDSLKAKQGVKFDSRIWEIETLEPRWVVDEHDVDDARWNNREPRKVVKEVPVIQKYFGDRDILTISSW